MLDEEDRKALSHSKYAFPNQRKEPIEDATHIRAAITRFDQVKGVTDADRDTAWDCIVSAAYKFDVEVTKKSWRDLGKPA